MAQQIETPVAQQKRKASVMRRTNVHTLLSVAGAALAGLRGMLLNAYGWWKASQIMYIADLTAYGLAALALVRGHNAHTPTETVPTQAENITA